MKFTKLELLDLNVDYSEAENIFINVDSEIDTLYNNESSNIYIDSTNNYDSRQEKHFEIITGLKNNFTSAKISSLNQINETITSDLTPAKIAGDIISDFSSLDGSSGSNAFLITEHWGHEYVTAYDDGYYFADAEKHPRDSGAGDDLLCWAAAASNVLQWGGWANGVDDGAFSNEQNVLDYFAAHWDDDGNWSQVGWEWWMTGKEAAWSKERDDAAHVDVAGAGFFSNVSVSSVVDEGDRDNGVIYTFETYWDFIVEHVDAGYGISLGISFGSNMGHAITAWGYEESDGVKYLYYSDSDDSRDKNGGAEAAPNLLKKTRFTLEASQFFNPDLAQNGIYVLNDYGPRAELDQITALRQYDSDMGGVTETFTSAKQISLTFNEEVRRGNVDVTGDRDYYYVNVDAAGYINVSVEALTSANTDFYIYDNNEQLVAEVSGSETTGGFAADIGRYYIVVEGDSFNTGGKVTDNTYLISFGGDSILPSTPEGLTQTIIGDDLGVDWSDSTDGSGIKNYQVQLASDEGFETILSSEFFTNSDGIFSDLDDGSYSWRVRAQDNAANWSEWSQVKSFTVDTLPPSVPESLGAGDDLPDDPGGDYLTWSASSDANGIRRYVVEYADNAGLAGSTTINVTDNKVSISQLPGILTYHWRVKAIDNNGNASAWSETQESFIADDVAPSTPVGLGRISDRFAWDVSTDDRSGIKDYTIEYSENADWADSKTVTSGTNEIAISALDIDARTYYWRVKATDNSGNYSWSETKTFTKAESGNQVIPPVLDGYTHLGSSVAISGYNIAVGADAADSSSKVQVYRWNESQSTYYEYALDGTTGGSFVLMSGDNVVVGGQSDDVNGTDAGAMQLYYWNGLSYESYKLRALDGMQYDSLGSSVSVSGNDVVAGVTGDDDNGANSGSAYIFRRYESSYEEYKITASDGSRHDAFGSSVSIFGDKVFVGAYQDDNDNGEDAGSLYMYKWNTDFYDEISKLTASDGAAGDHFGVSLSSDGNNIVVGADRDDDNGSDSGSAYVYRWNEETLSYNEYKLTASDGSSEDYFGSSVSISGDYVAVGSYNDDDGGSNSGSVYIYQWDGDGYDEIKKIIAADGAADKHFGYSVSISGDNLIVGTEYASNGRAYIYSLTSEAENPLNPIFAIDDPDNNAPSGLNNTSQSINWRNVELDWDDAFDNKIGTVEYIVEYADNEAFNTGVTEVTLTESELKLNDFAGKTNYYWRVRAKDENNNLSNWSETKTFRTFDKSSPETRMAGRNGEAGDYFGSSVAAYGNNRLVGAYGEESSAGNAYVYRWDGSEYGEYKLTASNSAVMDDFGSAVSMSGDTVVIGAYGNDNDGDHSGSTYVYRWSEGPGSYDAGHELTASDAAAWDCFGASVSISGDDLVVGGMGSSAYVYRWDGDSYTEHKLNSSETLLGTFPAGISSEVSSGLELPEISHLTTAMPEVLSETVDPNSMFTNASNAVDSRIAGLNAGVALKIFNVQDHENGVFTRNSNVWTGNLDLTSISPSNYLPPTEEEEEAYETAHTKAGTLITSKHIVFAASYQLDVGDTVRFVTENNVVIERTLAAKTVAPEYSSLWPDYVIAELDSPVPDSITSSYFLPDNVDSFMSNGGSNAPALVLDQEEKALIANVDSNSEGGRSTSFKYPDSESDRYDYSEELIDGDASNPAFLIIDNQLTLLSVGNLGGPGGGTNLTTMKHSIQDIIEGFSSDYVLNTIDISHFTTYETALEAQALIVGAGKDAGSFALTGNSGQLDITQDAIVAEGGSLQVGAVSWRSALSSAVGFTADTCVLTANGALSFYTCSGSTVYGVNFAGNSGNLTIGENGSIYIDSNNSSQSFGIYSTNEIETSGIAGSFELQSQSQHTYGIAADTLNFSGGDISGTITVNKVKDYSGTLYSKEYTKGLFSSSNLTTANISGVISVKGDITNNAVDRYDRGNSLVRGLYAEEHMIIEDVSGTISSTAITRGTNNSYADSYGLYALGGINMGEVSGSITASSSSQSGEVYARAVHANNNLIIDGISGRISATATATNIKKTALANAVRGNVVSGVSGAALTVAESAVIRAVANGNVSSVANAFVATSGMNLDIYGSVSATGSNADGTYRSLYSCNDFSDTVILRSSADITGDIVLNGGADTLSFKSGNSDFTSSNVAGDITGDNLAVNFDIQGFSFGSTILDTSSDGFGSTFSISLNADNLGTGQYVLIDSSSSIGSFYDYETFVLNGNKKMVVGGSGAVIGDYLLTLDTVSDNQLVLDVVEFSTVAIREKVDPNSMLTNARDAVDNRIFGLDAEESLKIFDVQDHGNGIFVRNPNVWTGDLDLTCMSPSNSNMDNRKAGTLITDKHIVFAAHYSLNVGDTVRFVTEDNEVIERKIVDKTRAPEYSSLWPDYVIAELDSPVPESITSSYFLPDNVDSLLGNNGGRYAPGLVLDQEEKALIADISSNSEGGRSTYFRYPDSNSDRYDYSETIIGGDSGNPSFLIINGQLTLQSVWTYGGGGSGTNLTTMKHSMQDIIEEFSFGAGYTLSTVDVSHFTTYEDSSISMGGSAGVDKSDGTLTISGNSPQLNIIQDAIVAEGSSLKIGTLYPRSTASSAVGFTRDACVLTVDGELSLYTKSTEKLIYGLNFSANSGEIIIGENGSVYIDSNNNSQTYSSQSHALYANNELTTSGIAGSIELNSDSEYVHGITASTLDFSGGDISGSITVNKIKEYSGTSYRKEYTRGLFSLSNLTTANISGAISVTGDIDNRTADRYDRGNSLVRALYADVHMVTGDISGAVSSTAITRGNNNSYADSYGLYALGTITMGEVSGSISASSTSQSGEAYARAVHANNNLIIDGISGMISATATATNTQNSALANAVRGNVILGAGDSALVVAVSAAVAAVANGNASSVANAFVATSGMNLDIYGTVSATGSNADGTYRSLYSYNDFSDTVILHSGADITGDIVLNGGVDTLTFKVGESGTEQIDLDGNVSASSLEVDFNINGFADGSTILSTSSDGFGSSFSISFDAQTQSSGEYILIDSSTSFGDYFDGKNFLVNDSMNVCVDGGSVRIGEHTVRVSATDDQLVLKVSTLPDSFGNSVDISGKNVVVADNYSSSNGIDSGSIKVYHWHGDDYNLMNTITASDAAAFDEFGYSVSIFENTVVVGAIGDDDNGRSSGSAYVYRWNDDSYDEYKLTASDGAAGDNFGSSVEISGDYVVIGARNDDNSFANSGSVYLYKWNGSDYSQIKKIVASDGAAGDNFGSSVSLNGDDLLVGTKSGSSSDSAYSYVLSEVTGNEEIVDETAPSIVSGMTQDTFYRTAQLDWEGSDNKAGFLEYTVEYADNELFTDAISTTLFASELVISGLEQESSYYWRVKAKDDAGNENDWSATEEFSIAKMNTLRAEETKLTASDGEAEDYFGLSVSISGDNVVAGAYGNDDNGSCSGSAYVYRKNGDSYDKYKLTASDGAVFDAFGNSVSISGDNVVAGAQGGGVDPGSAYVYRMNGGSYDEYKLTASDGAGTDAFGYSVSISGDNVLVGSYFDDDNGTNSGSAYVYRWDGAAYNESKLTASDGAWGDQFGRSVSISGDTVVVGSHFDDDNGFINSGSAYAYRWNGLSYTEHKLTASNGAAYDSFGVSVSVFGDNIVVGANQDDDNGVNSGSAYVYRWNGSSYDEYKLLASDGAAGDSFGISVSISDDYVVVGAYGDNNNSGKAYIYLWNGSSYDEVKKLGASDGVEGDRFGFSVSVSDNKVVVGAYQDDVNGDDSGSAYVYYLSGVFDETAPSIVTGMTGGVNFQSAELDWTDSIDDIANSLGYIVEYADNASFTGAISTTVSNSELSLSGLDAGTSYYWRVKTKDDVDNKSVWGKTETFTTHPFYAVSMKLTASDSSDNAHFGDAVSISGDNMIVGSHKYTDEKFNAGKAYVYRKNGDSYDEYKLTAADVADYDYYGVSVSISGDNVIVGADGDDDYGFGSGSAYVYRWDEETLSYNEYKLNASDGAEYDYFGHSVSISGDNMLVGAYRDDDNGTLSGSAYVYRWDGVEYDEHKFTASDGTAEDRFGYSVSISGDTVVIGSKGDDSFTGSAYVYRWDGTEYDEYKLIASDGAAEDNFGGHVAISGDTVVVGAVGDDDHGENSGSAYVYRWSGTSYNQYKLTASDGATYDNFGWSVAVSGDYVVVGAFRDGEVGSAYVYHWNGSSYSEIKKLIASDGAEGDEFGCSVSISGNTVLVGSREDGIAVGSAHIYEIDDTAPSAIIGMIEITSPTSAALYWADSTDANSIEYIVQYADNALLNSSTTVVVTESELALSSLEAGSSYYWRVKARDDAGNESEWSENRSFEAVDATAPSVVTGLTDDASYHSAQLDWADSTDNVGTTGYIVEYADNDSFTGATSSTVTESELALSNLNSGTDYYWRAKAKDDAGNEGNWSATNTFTTTADTIAPSSITGMTEVVSCQGAQLDWADSTDNVGTTGYIVEYADNDSFSGAASTTVTESELSLSNLDKGTNYYWRVRAKDDAGNASDWSATDTFETLSASATSDFDGNGKSDILWTNETTGQVGAWVDADSTNWRGIGASTEWEVVGYGNFNNNDISDIIWQNKATGGLGVYDDSLASNWRSLGGSATWEIQSVSDIDGNGTDDIIWREPTSGAVGAYMDGLAGNWQSLGEASSDWQIIGNCNLDDDNKNDILWANETTGQVGAWVDADSTNWRGIGASTEWEVVGCGNFNDNDISDILWQNKATGGLGVYDDGLAANWRSLGGSDTWKVQIVSDIDGNGTDDILWREPTSGAVGVYMDGLANNWQSLGESSSDWQICLAS
jgi:plastocyanin